MNPCPNCGRLVNSYQIFPCVACGDDVCPACGGQDQHECFPNDAPGLADGIEEEGQ